MSTLSANEKRRIVQLVASGQFKTIDNFHAHTDGPDRIYEWWIIDVHDRAHVIFETANKAEYDAKDQEAHAFVEEQRKLQSKTQFETALGQVMTLLAGLSGDEMRKAIRLIQEWIGDDQDE